MLKEILSTHASASGISAFFAPEFEKAVYTVGLLVENVIPALDANILSGDIWIRARRRNAQLYAALSASQFFGIRALLAVFGGHHTNHLLSQPVTPLHSVALYCHYRARHKQPYFQWDV
jgi:hypothetical protein